MYILCYDSYADSVTKQQLWQLIKQGELGFISDRLISLRIWIPADLVSFALLIDPTLVRRPKEDYIR